jgi:hypothetical protein
MKFQNNRRRVLIVQPFPNPWSKGNVLEHHTRGNVMYSLLHQPWRGVLRWQWLYGLVWFPAIVCQAKLWESLAPHMSTFVVCHTSLIVWPTCHKVNFLANFCQSLASNFLTTLCGCHTLPNFGLANCGWEPNRPYILVPSVLEDAWGM